MKLYSVEKETMKHGLLILSHVRAALEFNPNCAEHQYANPVLIRMIEPDTNFLPLAYPFYNDVLELKFEDIDMGPGVISAEQALEIAKFFIKNKDTDLLVVHCRAGISRSSGVGVAWAVFKGDKELGDLIYACRAYIPNAKVATEVQIALLDLGVEL